jgi:fatty acid/phospholipid biosynthesis enzyme
MKSIIIALNEETPNLKKLVAAIKVFKKHNPSVELHLFGTASQLNVLKNYQYVVSHEVEKDAASLGLEEAKKDQAAFIFLGSRKELLKNAAALQRANEEKPMALGLLLPTRVYNHFVFFLDLGLAKDGEKPDLETSLTYGKDFLKKVHYVNDANFVLMALDKEVMSTAEKAFDENHEGEKTYLGVEEPGDLLEGKGDIVVGSSDVVLPMMEGAKGAVYSLYNTEQNEIKKSFVFRLGMYLLGDVSKTMKNRFDWTFYANGLYLLGGEIPFVGLEADIGYGGLLNALDNANRLLEKEEDK